MARGTSIQKPTTLLTIKKSQLSSTTDYLARKDIVLMTDDGIITGDIRVATGNPPTNTTTNKTIPIYPIGSIIYFAGFQPPQGFLLCNGAQYLASLYPELTNYLDSADQSNNYVNSYASQAYNGVRPYTATSGIYAGQRVFNTPNFTNSGAAGGYFIRNLNVNGAYGNSSLPDYYITQQETNQTGGYSGSQSAVNRTFGSYQDESYIWHNHDMDGSRTGATGENHFHHYFGAASATNGYQLGDTYKSGETAATLFSLYRYQETDTGTGTTNDDSSLDYNNRNMIGTHIHHGFLGYGNSVNNDSHNTYHDVDSDFDNSSETRPKNYSLHFCIKY